MKNLQQRARNINVLGAFLGMRDLSELSVQGLKARCGLKQVDVMVLFGGSHLQGGQVLAQAMEQNLARRYLIVGGEGHTPKASAIRWLKPFRGGTPAACRRPGCSTVS